MSVSAEVTEVAEIIHAEWILPIAPAVALRDHAVVVNDGRIVAVMPSTEARLKYRGRSSVELPGKVLLPGLVNTHGHAAMALLRGLADDLPMMRWLTEYIWPAESRWVSADFVRDGTAVAISEMLLSGTTCFSDMYFFPDVTARLAAQTGIRTQLAAPILEFATAWGENADEYIHKALALHDEYRDHPLVRIAFGPHAPYSVSPKTLGKVSTLAEELDLCIQMHVHETREEITQAVADHGHRPLGHLAELELLSPRLQCVHMTQVEPGEPELLARHGVHVVHCPSSNLKLASGFCPAADLVQAGVNVALGTDGAASSNHLDLFSEMRLAALLAKAVSGDAAAVDARQALEMATLNGARALGLEAEIGSLEPGKSADMIAVSCAGVGQWPLHHPESQLVYTQVGPAVTHSWIQGKAVVRGGALVEIDLAELQGRVAQWQTRLQDR